jgi:iron complex outermembrane recepter protein
MRRRGMTAVIVGWLALTGVAWAQSTTGRIEGTVKDSTGLVVPGATVTASTATEPSAGSAVTGKDGSFTIALQPGTYKLTVELAGFQNAVAEVTVVAGKPASVAFEMKAGGVTEEVTVTGTLLRGVQPIGTNLVEATQEQIVAKGVSNSNDLLAVVPQVTNMFQSTPAATSDQGAAVNRPNIRNLGASGANTTLVVMDGVRMPGAGVLQSSADPGVIPTGAIERLEVVPDGGSSIYGSDAIGGVINFIMKRKLSGFEGNARIGAGDAYTPMDANVSAGRIWKNGGVFGTYSYAHHDEILGKDRSWVTQDNTANGGTDFRSNACSPGNITLNGVSYALPSKQPGTNRCDTGKNASFYPEERRHSVYSSLNQAFNQNVHFDINALYTDRLTNPTNAQLSATNQSISNANPFFSPVGTETSHSVSYAYDSVLGPNVASSALSTYRVMPTLTVLLPRQWQLKITGIYGRSTTETHSPAIDPNKQTAALASTSTATALNPYDLTKTNPAVIAGLTNYEVYARNNQGLATGRALADGKFFTLPTGDVRVAVGTEFYREDVDVASGNRTVNPVTAVPTAKADRTVSALFGEVFVPVVGNGHEIPGVNLLVLSASARYDHYSDVGGTTNPKVGLNYAPFDGLTVRANYGTSFNAPSLLDTVGAVDSRAQILGISPFRAPGSPFPDLFRRTVLHAGGNPNLKPQTADTYSIGFDLAPKPLRGFSANITYWNVGFVDAISLAPFFSPALFTNPAWAAYYVLNPTKDQLTKLLEGYRIDGSSAGVSTIDDLYANGQSPYVYIDARRNNLGTVDTDGLDFAAGYTRPTSLGVWDVNWNGTYVLNRKTRPTAGADQVDDIAAGNFRRFNFILGGGLSAKKFSGRALLSHSHGYPVTGVTNQTSIDSFNTVDLFFSYDLLKAAGKNVALTLNIDNVANSAPPYLNVSGGYGNGSTLGRVFTVGIRTKF